jgi:hypothetical protein
VNAQKHEWLGEVCLMCGGTGRDASAVTVPDGICQRVVGYAENGMRCRACQGHGREAS